MPWLRARNADADVVENDNPTEVKYADDVVEKKLFCVFQ